MAEWQMLDGSDTLPATIPVSEGDNTSEGVDASEHDADNTEGVDVAHSVPIYNPIDLSKAGVRR